MPKPPKSDEQGSRFDWKGLVPLILTIIGVVGGGIWLLHGEFGKVQEGFSRLDRRLDRFDSAIRILSRAQSGDVRDLINEILTQANQQARLGNPTAAAKFLAVAAKLTKEEAQRRAPASPEFFGKAVNDLRQFPPSTHAVDQQVRTLRLELAEYRSALTPLGDNVTGLASPGGVRGPIVEDSRLTGGIQILDGITWINVVFENTHIRYKGGPLRLRNVRFVNCTFDVPESPRGDQLLDIAILGESSATVG